MNTSLCTSCNRAIDADDNFCRGCGAPVASRLPAVREVSAPAIWQPTVSPVVKGAAVMAAGTIGQFVMRRVVSNLLNNGAEPRKKRRSLSPRHGDDGMVDEAHIITETVMLRRVRVRRQP